MIRCPICRYRAAPVRDHDHVTGKDRGLLCRTCNVGLGMFKDDAATISRAASYLRKHARTGKATKRRSDVYAVRNVEMPTAGQAFAHGVISSTFGRITRTTVTH